jgi:hypothetical protein
VKAGRFGSYINWKRVNAKLPTEYIDDPSQMPLEEAWSLIGEKAATAPRKSRKGKKGSGTIELPPGPKRAISAYLHFCADKRPEVAATMHTLGAVSKELARLWKEVPEQGREPFIALAEKGKAEYEEKKQVWLKECDELLAKNGASATHNAKKGKKSVRGGATNGPKRPRSSYVYFCSAKREEVSKTFGTLGKISKELGRLWSEAAGSERKEFEDMAAEDKLRYEREKLGESSVSTTKPAAGKKRSPSNKAKKKKKTKRGPSAYMLFCAAHRQDIVDESGTKLPLGETTKRLAKMWHECDEEAREEFQADAERQKVMA